MSDELLKIKEDITPSTTESDVDTDKLSKEHAQQRQRMSFREEVWHHWVRVAFLAVSALGAFVIVSTYLYHLMVPLCWRWLSATDLAKLKELAITIIVGLLLSAGTAYFLKKES